MDIGNFKNYLGIIIDSAIHRRTSGRWFNDRNFHNGMPDENHKRTSPRDSSHIDMAHQAFMRKVLSMVKKT